MAPTKPLGMPNVVSERRIWWKIRTAEHTATKARPKRAGDDAADEPWVDGNALMAYLPMCGSGSDDRRIRAHPAPRRGRVQWAPVARRVSAGEGRVDIQVWKRLASRLTWWHNAPQEHFAVNAAEGRGQPWTILASTSTRGKARSTSSPRGVRSSSSASVPTPSVLLPCSGHGTARA